ncbi:MAG: mono/diheme cytochrome c family protein [Oceanospirillaceae bacterium]|jgi:mono/diheme cytochrome c family protein
MKTSIAKIIKKIIKPLVIILPLAVVLAGCSESEPKVGMRWYTPSQLELGKQVFLDNCATCHGAKAQGVKTWRKPLSNGKYPPPPLNGSAHAWHHSLKNLKATVKEGGTKFGGTMPGFGSKLTPSEQEATISYFQSHWTKETYAAWIKRGGLL